MSERAPDQGVQVADPEEYNQTERLRAINQARQRVEETIQDSMIRLRTDQNFEEADRQQVLRAALYPYLTSVEWLMAESDGTEILSEAELGTVTIQPPANLRKAVEQNRVVGSPSIRPYEHTISGIQGYITAPEVFEESWTVTVKKRHSGTIEMSETKQSHMPVHISMNAFRMVNRYLNQAGIDVSLHEDQHRSVVGDEVLEEVEEWRQKNVQ